MIDMFMPALFMVLTIYAIFKNRSNFKELTKFQIFSVGISYLVAIFSAFILIYYGGNWLAGQFSNAIFKNIVFLAIVLIALYICVSLLNVALKKITNGLFPKN